jgi:hypothetical protein
MPWWDVFYFGFHLSTLAVAIWASAGHLPPLFEPALLQSGFYTQLVLVFVAHQLLFGGFLAKADRIEKRKVVFGATLVSAAIAVWCVVFFRLQDTTASFFVGTGAFVVAATTLCKLVGLAKPWAVVMYVFLVVFQVATMMALPFLAWSRGGRYVSRRTLHRQFGHV